MSYIQSNNTGFTAGSAVTCAFLSNVTAGNLLVVGFRLNASTILSVTDSQGKTYTPITNFVSGSFPAGLYYTIAASTGANTVTVTSNASTTIGIVIAEYSAVNLIDQNNNNNSVTPSLSPWTGPSITTLHANETIISFWDLASGGVPIGYSAPFTKRNAVNFGGTEYIAIGEDVVTSTGTYQSVATGNNGVAGNIIASFYTPSPADTPTFSPVAGSYGPTQNITISSTTGGSTLCYTIDGTTPTANGAGTCTHGTTYSTPVAVASSLTLKAIASESGFTDSSVGSAAYTINGPQATPTFSPVAGTYASTQNITITSSGADTIYYTTDGSTPTTGSSVYSTPVAVANSLTLKALAVKANWSNSAIGSAAYTISSGFNPDVQGPVLNETGWVFFLRQI